MIFPSKYDIKIDTRVVCQLPIQTARNSQFNHRHIGTGQRLFRHSL